MFLVLNKKLKSPTTLASSCVVNAPCHINPDVHVSPPPSRAKCHTAAFPHSMLGVACTCLPHTITRSHLCAITLAPYWLLSGRRSNQACIACLAIPPASRLHKLCHLHGLTGRSRTCMIRQAPPQAHTRIDRVWNGRGRVRCPGEIVALLGGKKSSAYWMHPASMETYLDVRHLSTNGVRFQERGGYTMHAARRPRTDESVEVAAEHVIAVGSSRLDTWQLSMARMQGGMLDTVCT